MILDRTTLSQEKEWFGQDADLLTYDLELKRERDEIDWAIREQQSVRSRQSIVVLTAYFGNLFVLSVLYCIAGGVELGSAAQMAADMARLFGMFSSYLLLVQLLLVGRIPLLDRIWGLDRLNRWHKHNGKAAYSLLVLHILAAIESRQLAAGVGQWHELVTIWSFAWMPFAVLGFLLLSVAIVTSVRKVRDRLDFNHWILMHVGTYGAVAMSFGHQLYGPDFAGKPLEQGYLWFGYGGTFALLFFYRIGLPLMNTLRHQLRIVKLVEESPGVTSIYMEGFYLRRFAAKPGQFCYWRFLTRRDWMESHPFSLSTAPNRRFLRITIKSLGDFSSRAGEIPVGTWVAFEGPFGGFTPESRSKHRTVLIAGGVGVTPICSLLAGMNSAPGDTTVIYRGDNSDDAVLLDELKDLATKRDADLHLVLGPRSSYSALMQPLSAAHLVQLVDDIWDCDVYICASSAMTTAVRATLRQMGVSGNQIHHETFA